MQVNDLILLELVIPKHSLWTLIILIENVAYIINPYKSSRTFSGTGIEDYLCRRQEGPVVPSEVPYVDP